MTDDNYVSEEKYQCDCHSALEIVLGEFTSPRKDKNEGNYPLTAGK